MVRLDPVGVGEAVAGARRYEPGVGGLAVPTGGRTSDRGGARDGGQAWRGPAVPTGPSERRVLGAEAGLGLERPPVAGERPGVLGPERARSL